MTKRQRHYKKVIARSERLARRDSKRWRGRHDRAALDAWCAAFWAGQVTA